MNIVEFQGYAYVFLTGFMVFILYGYIFHLYRSEKKGERNYEKYGSIALNDEITDKPVEEVSKDKKETENKEA